MPWIIGSQVLALEPWRPNFKASNNSILRATIWIRMEELPVELWPKKHIIEIAVMARKPLWLDN